MNTVSLFMKKHSLMIQVVIFLIMTSEYVTLLSVRVVLSFVSFIALHSVITMRGLYSDSDIEAMILLNILNTSYLF